MSIRWDIVSAGWLAGTDLAASMPLLLMLLLHHLQHGCPDIRALLMDAVDALLLFFIYRLAS